MEILFDYKFLFLSLGVILMFVGYYPYIKDIIKGQTQPHIYTWIIWFITQGVASFGAWYGGSFYTSIGLFAGTFMVAVIILLSLRYGTKNITKSDTSILFLALLAVFIWLGLENIFVALLMVSLIDGLGYIPSFRKTWHDPKSETPSFWFIIFLSTICTLFANSEFTFLTSFYLSIMAICNFIMFSISNYKK